MFRILAFALALLAATVAWGQTTYDPKIAYTSYEGNADNLYVANANGSNRVIVYKAAKVRLGAIDMAPVDPANPTKRKIAFSQSGVLKVLSYQVLQSGITTLGVVPLDAIGAPYQGANFPDFSPDGSKLLYIKNTPNINGTGPTDIYLVSVGGGDSKALWTAGLSGGTRITSVRWTGASQFAFLLGGGSPSVDDVKRAFLDANNDVIPSPETLFTDEDAFFNDNYLFGIEEFDVARTRTSLLFTTGTPPNSKSRTFVEYKLPEGTLPGSFYIHFSNSSGLRNHFSSDDAHILYLHISPRWSNVYDYVYLFDTAFPNNTFALTPKGQFGYADTQP